MDSLAQAADGTAVATEYLKQWAMGSNARRALQPKAEFAGPAERNYNLKNKRLRKFLQHESQTFGINLGWTDVHRFSTPVVREVPRPADPDFAADQIWSTS